MNNATTDPLHPIPDDTLVLVEPLHGPWPDNTSRRAITTAVTWSQAGSPYIVRGSSSVQNGGSLTIEPGVVVKFDGVRLIQVTGATFLAQGTAAKPIIFTSDTKPGTVISNKATIVFDNNAPIDTPPWTNQIWLGHMIFLPQLKR